MSETPPRADDARQALRRSAPGQAASRGAATGRQRDGLGGAGVGEVYLIGAGPGDPDLITVRGLRLLQCADVVLYDRLVSPELIARTRGDAQRLFVGKQRDRHAVPQEQINRLLAEYARAGHRVARLKGGDPFIFGRGGEEIDTLMAEGIPFQVVPGVTAASGCSAYAGIPLTHRDHAQACVFVTGHRRADGGLAVDFEALARPGQTVVIYMGLGGAGELLEGLAAHGLPAETPAAAVEQGTTTRQRVVAGSVADLAGRIRAAGLQTPALLIVGEVVRLRERLAWFDHETASRPAFAGSA